MLTPEMRQDGWVDITETMSLIGAGILGATCPASHGVVGANAARLLMIEQRILRIEMALRRAGIEVEALPLPEPQP